MKRILSIETEDFTLIISSEEEKQNKSFRESSFLNQLESCQFVIKTDVNVNCIRIDGVSNSLNKLSFWTKALFFENNSYQLRLINKKNIFDFLLQSNRKDEEKSILKLNEEYCQYYSYNNFVGLSFIQFSYRIGDMKRMFYFEFCVFPLKLNYDVDFKKIIKEILNESVNLNFSLLSKASFGFHIDKYLPLSPSSTFANVVWIQLFLIISERLIQACSIIISHPYSQIVLQDALIEKQRLKSFTSALCRVNDGSFIMAKTSHITYDTLENRFIKRELMNLINKLNQVENSLAKNVNVSDCFTENIVILKTKLERCLHSNLFSMVASVNSCLLFSSPVLEKKNGYCTFYRLNKILQGNSLKVDTDILLRIKQISSLFEIWCFLHVKNIICELLGVNAVCNEKNEELYIGLLQGRKSKIEIVGKNICVDLYYNATIGRVHSDVMDLFSLTEEQRPDILLKIASGTDVKFVVFDAKYRYIIKNKTEYHPVSDGINQIHRYRDSLFRRGLNNEYVRSIWGGFVLFPGYNTNKEMQEAYYYTSIKYTNIGAFQLIPQRLDGTVLLKETLSRLVES